MRKRKVRAPVGSLILTKRDDAFLEAVYRHRLMRTSHLVQLFGGGRLISELTKGVAVTYLKEKCDIGGTVFGRIEVQGNKSYCGWVDRIDLTRSEDGKLVTKTNRVLLRENPGWSEQGISRRCGELFHHEFFERLYEPMAHYRDRVPGSKPQIIGLADQGAVVLSEKLGLHLSTLRWSEKNRDLGDRHIAHTLGISDMLVGFETAGRGDVKYIPKEILLRNAPAQPERRGIPVNPLHWQITYPVSSNTRIPLGAEPDGFVALTNPETSRTRYYLLEYDRGTEPHIRTKLQSKSSIIRKALVYGLGITNHAFHTKLLGVPNLHILIVTTTPQRVANMIEMFTQLATTKQEGNGTFVPPALPANLFLVTDATTLSQHHSILTVPWKSFSADGTWVDRMLPDLP